MEATSTSVESYRDPNYTPPMTKAIPLGIQHVLAMFISNITVPIIIANVIGATPDERTLLIQAAMLIAGVATIIQTVGLGPVGARLPIMQGTSFGFVPILIPLAGKFGLGAVFGAAFIGGLFQLVLGYLVKYVREYVPPLVSGVVVLTIGISLMPVAVNYLAGSGNVNAPDYGSAENLLLGSFVVLVILVVRFWMPGFLGIASIFIGAVVGYLIAIPLGMVNFAEVGSASWLALPQPFAFGLELPWVAMISMLIMAFITSVETIGDIEATTGGGAKRPATTKELSGGIMADGFGTALASVFNALPNTSFSQNVGLVSFTGVMSRHVVTISGIILVIAGLLPKFGAIIATVPQSVIGGASLVMFGMIASAGIRMLSKVEFNPRNMFIMAMSLVIGIGLNQSKGAVAILPDDVQVLLTSGIVPAAVIAFVLNLIMPSDKGAEQAY